MLPSYICSLSLVMLLETKFWIRTRNLFNRGEVNRTPIPLQVQAKEAADGAKEQEVYIYCCDQDKKQDAYLPDSSIDSGGIYHHHHHQQQQQALRQQSGLTVHCSTQTPGAHGVLP